MKNILLALVIVLAVSGACNPPQKTTEPTTTDSTATMNSNSRDTSMSTQKDTSASPQRDTSMHN